MAMHGDVKDLILRYVKLDAMMRPIEIKARLLKDHGVTSTRNYIGRTRTTYLESLEIVRPLVSGRPLKQRFDGLLARIKHLQKEVTALIGILEREPMAEPEPRRKPRTGDKTCYYIRTKEQTDRYNARRRRKYREAKRAHS